MASIGDAGSVHNQQFEWERECEHAKALLYKQLQALSRSYSPDRERRGNTSHIAARVFEAIA